MQNKQEKEEKKRESEKVKASKQTKRQTCKKRTCRPEPLFNEDEIPLTDSEPDDAICPKCGLHYADDNGGLDWIGCDGCNKWFNQECTDVLGKNLPDNYFCDECRQ